MRLRMPSAIASANFTTSSLPLLLNHRLREFAEGSPLHCRCIAAANLHRRLAGAQANLAGNSGSCGLCGYPRRGHEAEHHLALEGFGIFRRHGGGCRVGSFHLEEHSSRLSLSRVVEMIDEILGQGNFKAICPLPRQLENRVPVKIGRHAPHDEL